MKRNNTPWRAMQRAVLKWDETDTPFSTLYDDYYYSSDDGLEESRYVFLYGSRLPERWQNHPRAHFCIGETGFGTGLNFLLTWQAWRLSPEPRPDLHYLSIEKHPLHIEDLTRVLERWRSLAPLNQKLLAAYPGLLPGQHRLLFDEGRVRLDLWWEDVTDSVLDLAGQDQPLMDAWYLDGFTPARNAAMWSSNVLDAVASLSHPGATIATFTSAGQVRRDLASTGFELEKVVGYGLKRECLRGTFTGQQDRQQTPIIQTPWDLRARAAAKPPQSAIVLGGGLAGCTAAAALARRGINVTVLERDALAAAGSGNEQGILYTRLSRKHSHLVDFALQSFRHASTFYHELFASGVLNSATDGKLCGNLQQSNNAEEMSALIEPLSGLGELAEVVDAHRASELLGVELPHGGLWYPGSGWLRPAAICKALVKNDRITVLEHSGELALNHVGGQWQASLGNTVMASADCAIVATGTGSTSLAQLRWLPTQIIRGQTTQLPTSATFAALRAGLCHDGYIAPPREGSHCIGATFDIDEVTSLVRTEDHVKNLSRLATAVPAWEKSLNALDTDALEGRVGYRCASPDYLPMIGPVPDTDAFLQHFSFLRRNARQISDTRGRYLPDLYLSTAHGSRGLSSTPIAAELLASMICAEPPPCSRELTRALAPARFLIRNLSRNRPPL